MIGIGFAVLMNRIQSIVYETCLGVPPIKRECTENDCEMVYFSEISIKEQLYELVIDRRDNVLIGRGFAVVMTTIWSILYVTCLKDSPINRERSEK